MKTRKIVDTRLVFKVSSMLVLLYGPSCVGKTSLIRSLNQKYNWPIIPTEMTRQLRPGETEKICITADAFEEKRATGYYICENYLYGNWYGTPLHYIILAQQQADPYLLDMPIKTRYTIFASIPHLGIAVLPESRMALESRINQSGRESRRQYILDEYDNDYNPAKLSADASLICIENRNGQLEQALLELASHIVRSLEA